ncbi:hypothetical protein BLOT_008668 [Blomia tropicalis]|nr:hypothetical protein BLOT_008668 [Blomia tropicalis]
MGATGPDLYFIIIIPIFSSIFLIWLLYCLISNGCLQSFYFRPCQRIDSSYQRVKYKLIQMCSRSNCCCCGCCCCLGDDGCYGLCCSSCGYGCCPKHLTSDVFVPDDTEKSIKLDRVRFQLDADNIVNTTIKTDTITNQPNINVQTKY